MESNSINRCVPAYKLQTIIIIISGPTKQKPYNFNGADNEDHNGKSDFLTWRKRNIVDGIIAAVVLFVVVSVQQKLFHFQCVLFQFCDIYSSSGQCDQHEFRSNKIRQLNEFGWEGELNKIKFSDKLKYD